MTVIDPQNDYDRLVAEGRIKPNTPINITSDEFFPAALTSDLETYCRKHGLRSVTALWSDDTQFQVRAHKSEYADAIALLRSLKH
jgi:hypothetical protein